MTIEEYFKLESVDDPITQEDFIEYVADTAYDDLTLDRAKVLDLDFPKGEWDELRDRFLY